MWDSSAFLGALTPKFYVALTGTSSLISGLILIFEWWYFRKYGTSFIEQVSLAQLGPWLGGGAEASPGPGSPGVEADDDEEGACRVRRNPLAPLRGAEYGRLRAAAGGRAPLTYYDMNLSAQEHQAWFTVSGAGEDGEEAWEAAMARAWREREPGARVAAARQALAARPDCAPALLLLAEEEAPTVLEAERVLRRAWRCAEAAWRRSALAAAAAGGAAAAGAAAERLRRDAAVLAHVKRRLAWCARRLGRLREAARLLRELCRDAPPALAATPPHEALLELLLEQRAYGDAAALLARAECGGAGGATLLYTGALLRARAATVAGANGGRAGEAARAALRRAVEYNPRVAEYLLEERPLAPPPEHVLRRGASEALAYAFWHARHWRACEGALRQLAAARGPPPPAPPPACAACADRELLAPPPVPWPRPTPRLLPLAAVACALAALAALAAHRWPDWPAAAAWAAAAARRLNPTRLMHLLSAL